MYIYTMVRDNLYSPFELVLKDELLECPRGIHTHTFFELVYILSGTGTQHINNSSFAYKPGHLFLMAPEDVHSFKIKTPTRFFFIRFNNQYIAADAQQHELLKRLELILENANNDPGCILKTEDDKLIVKPLIEAIIREHTNTGIYHKDLIAQYVNTLLVIVARNISLALPEKIGENSDKRTVDILQYIQANIYDPEKIRAAHLSDHFGITQTYLGRYFKRQTNESLQNYIMKYKIKLIENRLLHSNMRVTEIAIEFGFTDNSHFNRIFKKYSGYNPSAFKKAGNPTIALPAGI
jgi:AraC-like DNA-binding protein